MEIANWEVVELEHPTWHKYHIISGGETIALMDDGANAHLAAAAPDMYEALKVIEPFLKHNKCKYHGPMVCDKCKAQKLLQQALAKAEEG